MAVLLITHDLGVVFAVAEKVAVMYAGKVVEEAPTRELFSSPQHPYTLGLLSSFPKGRKASVALNPILGVVPSLGKYPSGCRFHPRCPWVFNRCCDSIPPLLNLSPEHRVACFLREENNSNG